MRIIRNASFDEVARSWVRAEKQSPRFHELYEGSSDDPSGQEAIDLLSSARGWPDRDYFDGFPQGALWYCAEVSADELRSIRYIAWDYWLEVTAGTRSPSTAIQQMGWRDWLLPDSVEPIVVVADSLELPSRLVVLEGHARLTRFVAAGEKLPQEIQVWVGVHADMANWGCY